MFVTLIPLKQGLKRRLLKDAGITRADVCYPDSIKTRIETWRAARPAGGAFVCYPDSIKTRIETTRNDSEFFTTNGVCYPDSIKTRIETVKDCRECTTD